MRKVPKVYALTLYMLIVAEPFDTFHHYFLMLVYPLAYFSLLLS